MREKSSENAAAHTCELRSQLAVQHFEFRQNLNTRSFAKFYAIQFFASFNIMKLFNMPFIPRRRSHLLLAEVRQHHGSSVRGLEDSAAKGARNNRKKIRCPMGRVCWTGTPQTVKIRRFFEFRTIIADAGKFLSKLQGENQSQAELLLQLRKSKTMSS